MGKDGYGVLEIDPMDEMDGRYCWCGAEAAEDDGEGVGVAFCPACRARVVRSCASILAIVRGRAIARRRAR